MKLKQHVDTCKRDIMLVSLVAFKPVAGIEMGIGEGLQPFEDIDKAINDHMHLLDNLPHNCHTLTHVVISILCKPSPSDSLPPIVFVLQ